MMQKALIVEGRLLDSTHVELSEPVTGMPGRVEVVLRAVPPKPRAHDVFDLIAALPPGRRSKKDIDEQLARERASWGER
jgi:hypothetical protein